MPLVDYYDKDGKLCNFVVSCTPPGSIDEVFELFDSNFQLHYTTNRAPFFMLLGLEWLQNDMYFNLKVSLYNWKYALKSLPLRTGSMFF